MESLSLYEVEEYDNDKLNPRPNPYAKELIKQITIKIAQKNKLQELLQMYPELSFT